jgi:hypothetical protein
METLVATVLIVVIFMVSSLVMESIFSASTNGSSHAIRERLRELEYGYRNGNLVLPYFEEWDKWEIEIKREEVQGTSLILLQAQEVGTNRTVGSYLPYGE